MGYSAGILDRRVMIKNKVAGTTFGSTTTYQDAGCVYANVTWKKGQRALNEGMLDSQDTVLIRMRWNDIVTRESRLECDGVTYQIQSLHADRRDNTIQITATEIIK